MDSYCICYTILYTHISTTPRLQLYKGSQGLFVLVSFSNVSSHSSTISPPSIRNTDSDSFYLSCRSLFRRQGNLLPWHRYTYSERLPLQNTRNTGHISAPIIQHLLLNPVYLIYCHLVNTFAIPRILLVTPPNSIRILHLNYSVNYLCTTNLIQSNSNLPFISNPCIVIIRPPSTTLLILDLDTVSHYSCLSVGSMVLGYTACIRHLLSVLKQLFYHLQVPYVCYITFIEFSTHLSLLSYSSLMHAIIR